MADIARFAVLFDAEAFDEDVAHATVAGEEVARAARHQLERAGVAAQDCKPCLAEGPEGTALPGCVKLYLPPPAGQWGLVLRLGRRSGEPVLYHIAFGMRHPDRAWQPSVYRVAHGRLQRASA